jgi:hypothetical protein
MKQYRLDGIRAKLDRADEHLVALADEIGRFVDSEPNRYVVDVDYGAGRYSVRVTLEKQPPPRVAIICGDYVHCLHSALDHLARGLVPFPSVRTAYPIYATPEEFAANVRPVKRKRRGRLHGLDSTSAVFAYIESTQPYNGPHEVDSHPIWLLGRLSDQDKHRPILTLVSAHGDSADLRVGGAGIEFTGRTSYLYDTPLKHGADVIRGEFQPITEGQPQVHVYGHPPLEIAFGDEGVPSESLHTLRDAVRDVVASVLRLTTV